MTTLYDAIVLTKKYIGFFTKSLTINEVGYLTKIILGITNATLMLTCYKKHQSFTQNQKKFYHRTYYNSNMSRLEKENVNSTPEGRVKVNYEIIKLKTKTLKLVEKILEIHRECGN